MNKTLVSALVLSLALGAGAASARANGDMGPRALPGFSELDGDGNGKVTQEELKAFAEARRAEMEAKRTDRMADRGQRIFDRFDANDDGALDADEYAAISDRVAQRMEKRGLRGWGRH